MEWLTVSPRWRILLLAVCLLGCIIIFSGMGLLPTLELALFRRLDLTLDSLTTAIQSTQVKSVSIQVGGIARAPVWGANPFQTNHPQSRNHYFVLFITSVCCLHSTKYIITVLSRPGVSLPEVKHPSVHAIVEILPTYVGMPDPIHVAATTWACTVVAKEIRPMSRKQRGVSISIISCTFQKPIWEPQGPDERWRCFRHLGLIFFATTVLRKYMTVHVAWMVPTPILYEDVKST